MTMPMSGKMMFIAVAGPLTLEMAASSLRTAGRLRWTWANKVWSCTA